MTKEIRKSGAVRSGRLGVAGTATCQHFLEVCTLSLSHTFSDTYILSLTHTLSHTHPLSHRDPLCVEHLSFRLPPNPTATDRCRANMARFRQSRPGSCLGSQVQVLFEKQGFFILARRRLGFTRLPALSQSNWVRQLGATGSFFAPRFTDVYRIPSVFT